MKKYVIAIEETVVEEFVVEAKSSAEALEISEQKYKKGEFVLAPGEVQFKQMAVIKPSSESTEWAEF